MPNNRYIMGLFDDDGAAANAIDSLRKSPWTLHRVHGPYPSHKVLDALKYKKSRLGYFTLAGGIAGFLTGYFLAIYSSIQWNLIVSGKPVVSLIPFFVVGYEMTILFGILATVLGLLITTRLPAFKNLTDCYDPRCSGEHFGIVALCDDGKQDEVARFFREKGGEVRVFE